MNHVRPLLILAMCALALPATAESDPELDVIRTVVDEHYIRGLRTRDFSLITDLCVPEATLMTSNREGKLHVTTLETWSKRFDPENPPFTELNADIDRIDRTRDAAQVRIRFVIDGTREITDYLHLLKLDGHWRVVHIIDS
ncbi:MAG: nuclear transport factor 2 family protein [bacterium]|nr:nuclear transport factor 2 family protein [bacterium]